MAPEQSIGIYGGVGSGKSYAARMRLLRHLLEYPGTTALMVRRVAEDLRRTTIPDMVREFGPYIYNVDKARMLISLRGGSKIQAVHGWDDERGTRHLDGYNVSAVLMSQAEECPEQTARKCRDRLRRTETEDGKKIGEHLFIVEGNPAGHDWIYRMFLRGAEEAAHQEDVRGKTVLWKEYKKKGSVLVQCPSADYSFVPEGYLDTLLVDSSERYISRYVMGEFDGYGGTVYREWNDKVHVIDPFRLGEKLPENYRRVIGIDWGYRNPTGVLWAMWCADNDTFFVYRESRKSGLTVEEQANLIIRETGKEDVSAIVIDPSTHNVDPITRSSVAQEFIKAFKKAHGGKLRTGWYPKPADNRVDAGIELVSRQMKVVGGTPGLYVFKGLRGLIREIEDYRYPEDTETKEPKGALKETPRKKDDHLVDALRYIVASKLFFKHSKKDRTVRSDPGGQI